MFNQILNFLFLFSDSVEQTFNESSFITYRPQKAFLETYNPKFTEIQMMIRTRDEDGGPLLTIRDKHGYKRLMLMVRNTRESTSSWPLSLVFVIDTSTNLAHMKASVYSQTDVFYSRYLINNIPYFQLTKENNGKLALEGKVNLGRKEIVVRLTNTLLGDGQWHYVTISRNRNEVHLGIDLDNDPRTAKGTSYNLKFPF